MGAAQQKLKDAGKILMFDFSAPAVRMLKGDRENLSKDSDGSVNPQKVVPRAVRWAINTTIQAAFPQGMDRRDGKLWAAWTEAMEDEDVLIIEVTKGQVEWLKKHVGNDDLKTNIAVAQWREALNDYLESLLLESAVEQTSS